MTKNAEDQLADLIRAAKKAGADAADALHVQNVSASVSYRLGRLEDVERSEASDIGLRVFLGQRVAFVSSTDFSKEALAVLPGRAVAMAKLAPEDKYACLAPRERLARDFPDLDTEDKAEPPAETLVERARAVEGAAMAVAGITNSEGGGAGFGRTAIALATTEGFFGQYAGTSHSIGVAVLAGEGTEMERDYDHASARHSSKSQAVPVVFDPRESAGLIGYLAGAISGSSIARGVSFLKECLGQQIFAPSVSIIDDPHRRRGHRSKPFDGEGVANTRMAVVENGVLKTWLLDCASAKQLGLQTTGHAARGTGGPPHPSSTNFYMQPGTLSPEELMADIAEGFYVTELMGMGVNMVTGDYSQGAAGFWIEKGKLAYPVAEVTIAGNLKDMYRRLVPASDLVFRYGTNAPTVRIEGMTVAGE